MARPLKVKFIITYYGTGMTPKRLEFDRQDLAEAKWEAMVKDPYAGAASLTKVEVLRTR